MGNKKAFFAISATALAAAGTFVACGSDKAATPDAPVVIHDSPIDTKVIDAAPDAPSFDFSCAGNSAPVPADNVTVSGIVEEVGYNGSVTYMPLPGATVDFCTGNCTGQNALGSGTTDGSGNFSIGPTATGGTAIDGYVKITHTGDRTIMGFPASPIAADVVQPIITFSNLVIGGLSMVGCTQSAQNGMIGVLITDCMEKPISDSSSLTISVQQNGSNVGDAPLDASALNPMAAGFFLICNVPPGTTTVNATYSGMTLRAHDVTSSAGTTTETIVRPGF
jgi:hypothetical protein